MSRSSAMIIPENAGGSTPATTSILIFNGSILKIIPTMRRRADIIISFRMDPRIACQLITILTEDKVTPAEKTAIEAFAPLIRSNDGLAHFGHGSTDFVKHFPYRLISLVTQLSLKFTG